MLLLLRPRDCSPYIFVVIVFIHAAAMRTNVHDIDHVPVTFQ